jgi:hypothetical protein
MVREGAGYSGKIKEQNWIFRISGIDSSISYACKILINIIDKGLKCVDFENYKQILVLNTQSYKISQYEIFAELRGGGNIMYILEITNRKNVTN